MFTNLLLFLRLMYPYFYVRIYARISTRTQNALQNYYKYLEYTRFLPKKYRLCSHKQYFSEKRLLSQHFSAILAVKRTDYNRTSCPVRV